MKGAEPPASIHVIDLPPTRLGRARREQGLIKPVPGIELAFALIEGRAPGPCLLVTAGVHGSELCGIEAALRLMQLDPEGLAGTLIILPILNMRGFRARSIYVMPEDGQNLNRMFPGRADGSTSERLAHWLTRSVYPRVDAYLDLHGGDLNESLTPFSLFPEGCARSRALAAAFALPFAVETGGKGFAIDAASALGVPSLIAEVGGNGLRTIEDGRLLDQGIPRLMGHLGMTDAASATPGAPGPEIVSLWSAVAPLDGLWYPARHVREIVQPGEVVGEIRDLFGATRATIRAEAGGTLLFCLTSLAVNLGEPLLGVGTPVAVTDRGS